jgi:phosphoribosylglycinamide formyltransferase-1
MRLAVLISGKGSNLQALIEACRAPGFGAEIALVIANEPDAYGLERARRAGLPVRVIDHREFAGRGAFEAALDQALRAANAELVCLAGFMRVLGERFVAGWRDRLINIHPSLLPAFKGLHVHERVLASGVRISGCTVHLVRAAVDAGPILVQAAVPVLPTDTAETLAARVQAAEHRCYPLAVELFARRRVLIEGETVRLLGIAAPEAALLCPAALEVTAA